jgi:Tol biopolymer transport system component
MLLAAFGVGLPIGFPAAVRPARATFPGSNGLIAFDRNTADGWSIAVVRPDRSGLQTLVPSAVAPAWSPDGRSLAFTRKTGGNPTAIFVADADGSNVREVIAGPAYAPAWSPDGKQLAYTDGSDLFVINLDGSGRRRLTDDGNLNDEPAWSPDGKWIAFLSYPTRETIDGSLISVIRSDGSNRLSLLVGGDTYDRPDWSPDGTKIVYAANGRAGSNDIYVVSTQNGSKPRRLTDTRAAEEDATWSPDGTQILYAIFTKNGSHSDFYVMNADGSGRRPLVRGNALKAVPDWQPTPSG